MRALGDLAKPIREANEEGHAFTITVLLRNGKAMRDVAVIEASCSSTVITGVQCGDRVAIRAEDISVVKVVWG